MKRILPSLALLVWFGASVLAAPLNPELMFKDTFNTATPSDDINSEAPARQSGKLAPLTYLTASRPPMVGQEAYPNMVQLDSDSLFSPNHNFIEGGTFSIEFDVDPGVNDDAGDGYSGDWCAIVFGASSQNVFVNGSDGIGILFRNNGDIQTFSAGAAVGGGPGIPGGLPKDRKFHVKIDVVTAGFKGSSATVKMFIDGQAAIIGPDNSDTIVKANGFRNNFITLEGYGFPGPWTHLFDEFQVSAVPEITVGPTTLSINKAVNPVSQNVTVTIPSQLNATAAAQVKVTSLNPSVAVPTGADANGSITLNFAAAGATSQTFTITGVNSGTATLRVEGPVDVAVNSSVSVFVVNGVGMAEMLFKDTFNTTVESWDVNFEIGPPRQTGTAAGATGLGYSEAADSAAGGALDHLTVVNPIDPAAYNGKLLLNDRGGGVSPMRNFNDGPEFYIEAEVNPGVNALEPDDDWAAIVFGTTSPNQFVISPDGFGILFRQNRAFQVWDAGTVVYSSPIDTTPIPPFKVRIDASAVNFAGAPVTISMKINDQVVPITATTPTYVKTAGFRGNYVTLEGTGVGLDHLFDDFTIGANACITFRDSVIETTPGQTVATTVQIPASLTATAPVVIKIRSSNPATANVVGATGAETTLNFAIGQNTAPLSIAVTGNGSAHFDFSNDAGICMGEPLVINSRTSFVKNPSFEKNYNPGFPHYSDITDWIKAGGTGVNDISGPFADNGPIPDRDRAAFIQGAGRIDQTLTGLTVGKQYWIQFRYNTRNCCGGTINMATLIDDVEIDRITDIKAFGPGEYGARTVLFTAAADTANLSFSTTAAGDATAVLDAVTVVQRDTGNVILQNPSFEASDDVPGNGLLAPKRLAGWTGTGNYGVTLAGASFADNGKPVDQDHVAFIQGVGSLAQTALRLTGGSAYKLEFSYNANTGKRAHLVVKIGGAIAFLTDVDPVGGSAAYRKGSVDFFASGTSAEIVFEQTVAGDTALLLDDVRLLGQSITLPCLAIAPSKLDLGLNQTATFAVTIPPQLIATGPATISLRSANTAVARLEGANGDGLLVLTFEQGGDVRKDVGIQSVSLGAAAIQVVDDAGLCVDNGVEVTVVGSFVRNPSFEANPAGAFPGYGSIASWTGGSGLNNSSGPFHDNGVIPDRRQIAFIQNTGTLSQTLANLEAGKTYWVQFRYNTRNCCGGRTLAAAVRFNDVDIAVIDDVQPVGATNPYSYGHAEFTPDATSGTLSFASTASGDATLLIDSVSVVQRDSGQVILHNPSFEAEGALGFPGYIQPDRISGWEGTGNYGVNNARVGPFADNGINPDQDFVAFIQGGGSLAQHVTGLTGGENYTLTFAANGRAGNSPRIRVSFDGAVIHESDVPPIGGTTPYATRSVVFTSAVTEGDLTFEQVAAGDNTVSIDNVMLKSGGAVPPTGPTLTVTRDGSILRLAWPTSATGFNLHKAATPNGTYAATTEPVVVDGQNNVVFITIPAGSGEAYFQLKK